jgi:hypothetical protein
VAEAVLVVALALVVVALALVVAALEVAEEEVLALAVGRVVARAVARAVAQEAVLGQRGQTARLAGLGQVWDYGGY